MIDKRLYRDLYSSGNLKDMVKLQKFLKPDFSIEVGAFDATYSFCMSQSNIPAYAFEADPFIYQYWSEIYSNKKNMNYIHQLIYNSNKQIVFYVGKNGYHDLSDKIRTRIDNSILLRNHSSINDFDAFECKAITLEQFIKNNSLTNKKFSMWVDAEGIGYEVLEGLGPCMQNLLSLCIETETCQQWKDQKIDKDIDQYLLKNNFIKYNDYPSIWPNLQYDSIYINKKYLPTKTVDFVYSSNNEISKNISKSEILEAKND